MSEQHSAGQSNAAGTSHADDDTLIRPTGAFYNGQPPAAPAAAGPGPATPHQASNGAGPAPTLAERIMRRLPAPPEKAEARQEFEERRQQAERERVRELEELRRADAARAAARQSASVPAPAPAVQASSARNTVTTQQTAPQPTAHRTATGAVAGVAAGGAVAPPRDPVPGLVPGATPSSAATPATAPVVTRAARRTRKARLRIARIDPWSVMKTFFLFSIASGIAFVTFVALLYMLVDGSGLFDTVDEMVQVVFGQQGDDTPFRIRQIAGWERVMGITALLACINVVILTALATLGSFLYNLSATMLGGLELTLAED